MHRFRGTDVGLGLLAMAVNVGLVVGVVAMTTGGEETTPEAAPSPTRSSASPSPTSTSTPSPSVTVTPTVAPAELLSSGDPVDITVLGDQTGDGPTEWVGVLGELLGQDHRVTVHDLAAEDPTLYDGRRTFGDHGSKVTIHNASRAGVPADYAATRMRFFAPDRPDIVILNYGRNDDADTIADRLQRTSAAARERAPGATMLVVLQPPTVDDALKSERSATRKWARKHDVTPLDVATPFIDSGQPGAYISPTDSLVMTEIGDRLWGEIVYSLLTDREVPAFGQDAAESSPTTQPTTLASAPVVVTPVPEGAAPTPDPTPTAEPTATATRTPPVPSPSASPTPELTPLPSPTPSATASGGDV